MSLAIAGMGWVTPLGNGIREVWERLLRGEEAVAETMADPIGKKTYPVFRVPGAALSQLPAHPRLRRASAISRFAAAAGLAAMAEAKSRIDLDMSRTALVFTVANGGVIYTKRFYHDIVATGAGAASPLLFPETVFNAAASHLAAILGIAGASYTLVGDGAIGLSGIRMAEDLLQDDALDCCLVVGAEEADWLLCDAYRKWRLLRSAPPIEIFQQPPRGTILSEGAGAILIAREGPVKIAATHPGAYYARRAEAGSGLTNILRAVAAAESHTVVASANGTFVDEAEALAIAQALPAARIYAAKAALGEGVGASALWQTIIGAQILLTNQVPPSLHSHLEKSAAKVNSPASETAARDVVISCCGLNQQIEGLRMRA
jgi:3-oxoacyl-(acyl-carrier-protein) synthase